MSDYITVENINHINAELSNFCNSACPMCPRYDSDLNLIKDISNNSHTTLSEIQNKIGEKVISQLKLLGFKNRNGSEILYADKKEGWLIRPDGEDGPIYIVFDNFLRLLEWNRSLRFAITGGTLSDKIKI